MHFAGQLDDFEKKLKNNVQRTDIRRGIKKISDFLHLRFFYYLALEKGGPISPPPYLRGLMGV
jgi:hypothetical protein